MEIEAGSLIDALPGLVWATLPDGRTGFVNRSWCDFTGQTQGQALESGWAAVLHPDDAARATRGWAEIAASGRADAVEARLRQRDGDYRRFRLHARAVCDSSGRTTCLCGYASAFEGEPLRAHEPDLWAFVDKLPPHFVFLAPGGEVQYVNRAIQDYYGRSLEDLKGWTQSDALHPDDRERVVGTWAAAIAAQGKAVYETTHRARRHDGAYRWMNVQMFPYWDEHGELVRWISLNTDVDDLKRAQLLLEGEVRILERLARDAALDEVLETFCRVVEACTDASIAGVLIKEPGATSLAVAAAPSVPAGGAGILAIEVILPIQRLGDAVTCGEQTVVCCDPIGDPQLASSPWALHMKQQALAACWLMPVVSGAQVLGVFVIYRRAPGQPSDAERQVMSRFAAIAGIAISKALADAAFKASEGELRRVNRELLDAQALSHVGSYTSDMSKDTYAASEELRRIWEFEADTKISLEEILRRIHPADRAAFEAEYANVFAGADSDFCFRIITPSGIVRSLHSVSRIVEVVDGGPVVVGIQQDETERVLAAEALKASESDLRRTNAELARVSRAMAFSALTASIAHEVNQPLAGIVANAATCLRMLAVEPPNLEGAQATAQRLVRDGARAAEVIQRLRALFANKPPALEPVDLNEAATEVLALSAAELQTAKVAVRSDLAPGLPPVRGDRVQLQQVILNLVLNAADAMRSVDDRARELTVTTVRDTDDHMRLSVRDVGVGVDPGNVERLFEAFHTTKESGMGVGLAVSRSIIESHEGRLWAEPNAGPGATFAFTVPAQSVTPPPPA